MDLLPHSNTADQTLRVSHQPLQFSWSHMVALIGQPSCQTWTQLTLLTDPHLLIDNQLELPMALIGLDFRPS